MIATSTKSSPPQMEKICERFLKANGSILQIAGMRRKSIATSLFLSVVLDYKGCMRESIRDLLVV